MIAFDGIFDFLHLIPFERRKIMMLDILKAISKRRAVNAGHIGKNELIRSIWHAEDNSDCFGTAFPLLLRVHAMELERQGVRR